MFWRNREVSITLQELITGIEVKNGFALDQAQKDAIGYGDGPLLIAAGPGTGKTEVLVARCLKVHLLRWRGSWFHHTDYVYGESSQNLEDRSVGSITFAITSVSSVSQTLIRLA